MSQQQPSQPKRARLDLFKVDPTALDVEGSLGLQNAITSHIQSAPPARSWQSPSVQKHQAESEKTSGKHSNANDLNNLLANVTYLSPKSHTAGSRTGLGTQLNHLDTESVSGIEHMLPTPSIRYRVMEERLNREIKAIEAKVRQYENIAHPSPTIVEQLAGLQAQYQTLLEHRNHVQQGLAKLYPEGDMAFTLTHQIRFAKNRVKQSTNGAIQTFSPLRWIRSTQPEVQALTESNTQITQMAQILETQLQDPGASHESLSQVINQLDQQIANVERQANQLRERRSLRDKVNSLIHQWFASQRNSTPIGLTHLP